MRIFQSASKIVFVLVAVTSAVGLFTGHFESKEWMVLASMAFTYYFGVQNQAVARNENHEDNTTR